MSGKLPMFGVLGLGLVASICAAVLMAALRSGGKPTAAAPTEIEVLVAKGDLPAMTRLEKDLIEVHVVSVSDKPDGAFGDPVQILGRVLKTALVDGQPITELGLLSEGDGAKLASSLPDGMRAVSVELPSSSAMKGLLYPGCCVDVIVAYKRVGRRPGDVGPDSRTLLQNVSVLAVEDKTVFTVEPETDEDAPTRPTRASSNKGLMVTLMVDPQQARELQAARDTGELSLTLRNPLDASTTADPTATPLDQAIKPDADPDGPWRMVVIRGNDREVQTFNERGEAEPREEKYADAPADPPSPIDE
ncbi:MAG: Flp pilus assembly protein CpaB [Phycisphaeraceae bacterium]|nr:MAG: Flp pilus assembly protein CpaB [Phycisphaeraceae bacterium]